MRHLCRYRVGEPRLVLHVGLRAEQLVYQARVRLDALQRCRWRRRNRLHLRRPRLRRERFSASSLCDRPLVSPLRLRLLLGLLRGPLIGLLFRLPIGL